MKKIIKNNQIVIFTIALMLIVAGYINYTSSTQNLVDASATSDSDKYAEIGDAMLVSGNVSDSEINEENNIIANDESENNIYKNSDEDVAISNSNATYVGNDNNRNEDIKQYFTQSRIDRDNMFSQIIESYQKIINSDKISDEQRSIAEEEIKNINNRKNAIMISENLIKNKGFDDVIIFVNDKNINVVVKSDDLKQEQVAQIQNIIQREMNADTENIHISNK